MLRRRHHLSRVLELTLTGKEGGRPWAKADGRHSHHAAERYCGELIRHQQCGPLDQLEATPAKGPAQARHRRGAHPRHRAGGACYCPTQQLAVVIEPAQGREPMRWGLASADVSTGEVQVMQRQDGDALHQQLAQLGAELLGSTPEHNPPGAPTGCG